MKKRHIIITCIAIAALVTAFAIISRCSREESQEGAPQLRLNDTLTNAMSDIPELAPMDKKIRNFMTRCLSSIPGSALEKEMAIHWSILLP